MESLSWILITFVISFVVDDSDAGNNGCSLFILFAKVQFEISQRVHFFSSRLMLPIDEEFSSMSILLSTDYLDIKSPSLSSTTKDITNVISIHDNDSIKYWFLVGVLSFLFY
jgi:hypothetical protein